MYRDADPIYLRCESCGKEVVFKGVLAKSSGCVGFVCQVTVHDGCEA